MARCPALRRHPASIPELLRAALLFWIVFIVPAAAQWHADIVPTSGRVTAIDVDGAAVRISAGPSWYQFANDAAKLVPASPSDRPKLPRDALPDGRMIVGTEQVARVWLAAPTSRYNHGVLGDAIEAGSLVIERHDGRHGSVTLSRDAVFEDISPRIASIDGRDWIVVVKSYLDRGSALAVIDADSMTIAAETPPIGHSHAWLNPAGIADYDGNGTTDIALVRQPHVVGRLELWSWRDRKLTKVIEIADVSNHFIGSRALGLSWTADFDGDGHPDLAVPSLDRRTLRIIGFTPEVRDIARVRLPARIVTNIGAVKLGGKLALIAGVEDGRLVLIRNQ